MRPQTGRWPDLGHGSDARAVRGRPPSSRKMTKMGWLRPVALWAQTGTVMESTKGLGPLLLGLFLLLLFLGERKVASLCARRVRTLIDTEVRGKAHRKSPNQPTNLGEETGWEIGGGGLPLHTCRSFVESHGSLEQDGLPFSQRRPITRAGEEGTEEGHEIHPARRAARLFLCQHAVGIC